MSIVKEYVINLVATLVFITAVELIAPENNMKKYLKFSLMNLKRISQMKILQSYK